MILAGRLYGPSLSVVGDLNVAHPAFIIQERYHIITGVILLHLSQRRKSSERRYCCHIDLRNSDDYSYKIILTKDNHDHLACQLLIAAA
jgi:hypothetical protein